MFKNKKIMKKFNFKTRLKKDSSILDKLCLSLLGLVCLLFCGCSSTISEDPQSDKSTDDLVLASFAKEHQALVKSLLQGSGINGSDETEASEDSVRVAGIISKIEGNLNDALSKQSQPEVSTRAEEMSPSDIINVGSYELLEKINGRVSTDFYNICEAVVNRGVVPVTEMEVINNNNMAFNEKIAVLLFLPVLSDAEMNPITGTRSKESCLKTYKSHRNTCGVEYAAACAISCIGGPVGAAAGVALATYQLDNCLDDALYHYRNCK